MTKAPTILRYGIMTNGLVISKWQHQCIQLLEDSGIAKLVIIINKEDQSTSQPSTLKKAQNYFNKNGIYKIASRFLYTIPALENLKVAQCLPAIKIRHCDTQKKGKYSEYFFPEDLKAIESENLDFILRFGYNIIRGEVLKIPRYGIWSFHHGNELEFRGGPTGFWEIFRGSKTNGIILQKLNDLIDAGVIIHRRTYQTVFHSYKEHLQKLLMQSTDMPLQVCRQIIQNDLSNFKKDHSSSKAPMNRIPKNGKMIQFLFKVFINRLRFHYNRLFKQEHWDIGISNNLKNKIPNTSDFTNTKWLKLRKGAKYAADSFCFESNNTQFVIFEDYDYKHKRGSISLAKLQENLEPINIKTALEKPYHLAYPYIFQHHKEIFLIPETAENGSIELYKWREETEEFIFEQELLNVAGVDSSLVYYKEKWWLFCGLKDDLPNEKLHIYYADQLLGPYQAHSLNPVKVDPNGSRPAGQFIIENNVLYRPAQKSVKWYGESINWFEVEELNENAFCEKKIAEIAPHKKWTHKDGVHTFAKTSQIMVIDAKRRKSGWHAMWSALGL